LKAISVSDALERACYSITYASPWRPEDVELHAVYDLEENLLWIDEPFYNLVQKKYEFRGMERREFLARFGATSAAILFGLRATPSNAATTSVSMSGAASGFSSPGEQLYTTTGSFNFIAPAGVTSVSVVAVGAGGSGASSSSNGGAGGGLGWKNAIVVVPGNSYSVVVGGGGAVGNHCIWCILLPAFPQDCRASGVEKQRDRKLTERKDDGGEVHHHSAGN
jgi:hypothetical protein